MALRPSVVCLASKRKIRNTKPLQLAVCCLNISEGRNRQIVQNIAKAAIADQHSWKPDENTNNSNNNNNHFKMIQNLNLKCKATVLSVYTDDVYNRGNITIAAPIEYLATSVYQASLAAFETIDLTRHVNPGHPRLGAVDLIPIHPVSSTVSLETCGIVARDIATRIVNNINGTSVFLFGHADDHRRGLIQRRKEFNWFDVDCDTNLRPDSLPDSRRDSHPDSCSDMGEDSRPDMGEVTARCGITGVGGICYTTVLNIVLDTDDLLIGRKIAATLCASNPHTGLPGVQAMAFKKSNGVEIACNVETNDLQSVYFLPVFKTSFENLEDAIIASAAEYNISVLAQDMGGFTPYEVYHHKGFTPHEAYNMASQALTTGNSSPWKLEDIVMM